ncbi:MAG: hypothetical protein JW738_05835 [Actinobacteria bacterium]|nr:hypothetical protein [Actinomycetota bacterium]
MKRFVIAVLAITFISGLLVLLPGCGGDQKKAEEYMDAGDKIISEIKGESEELEGLGNEITGLINAIFTEQVPTSTSMKEKADQFEELKTSILEQAEKAKNEYSKILDLSGVEDYKEYAELAIGRIETMEDLYENVGLMLDDIVATLEQHESGATVDAEAFAASLQDYFDEIEKLGEKAEEMKGKLEELNKKL